MIRDLSDDLSHLIANKPDSPLVARIRDMIIARYPGTHLVGVGHHRGPLQIDIETTNAIIEVKPSNGQGLTRQVTDRQDPDVNPEGKPVIGFAPKMGHAGDDVNAAGRIAAGGGDADNPAKPFGTLEDLLDVVAPDPQSSR